ncbi:hypothetical protein EBZ02_02190, partial [bacterium]|nr:hypothetical protein [bacterium]
MAWSEEGGVSAGAATAGAGVAGALAALKSNPRLKVEIADSTQNLALYLDALSPLSNNITRIAQTDAATGLM